jgi:hypothetical protein
MNPTLPEDYLERMRLEDPEAYRSEVLGEFRTGVLTFLDPEAIEAVLARDVRERPPMQGTHYVGFADPSGGRHDAFTLAVAHQDRETGVAVQDCLRAWSPPFNPGGVVSECADILKAYGIGRVTGDRYSAEFVAEHFRSHGIKYEPSELDRSSIYLELLPMLNSRTCRLLDLPELVRELRGLERKVMPSGRDRVDHGPRGTDDKANATAGALVACSKRRTVDMKDAVVFGERLSSAPVATAVFGNDEFDRGWLSSGGGDFPY